MRKMKNMMNVSIIFDEGLINEGKEEVEGIIGRLKEPELKLEVNHKNCEEKINCNLTDEEIEILNKEEKICKRLEIKIKKGEENVLNSIKRRTYKIKTREDEDVKEVLDKIKDIINLDELILNLKKPEIIIEYNNKEEKVKISIKQPKRDYFVFAHSRSIRPNMVRGLIKKLGLNREVIEGTLIDLTSISPFCLEAEGINKNINLLSWSWSSRITNLMRKNCLVARNKRIQFDHGILSELIKKHKEDVRKNVFVFGQFLFVNERVIKEIINAIREVEEDKSNNAKFLFAFDKPLSKKFVEENKLKFSVICQGKRKIHIYSSI